jgi:hypothetical protein
MGLDARLKQLESKINSWSTLQEHSFNTDDCITHMGLDPVAVRESVQSTGSSIAVAVSAMLGIEPREFARLLKEKVNFAK